MAVSLGLQLDEESVRRLLAIRRDLLERVSELEEEIRRIREVVRVIEETLTAQGFRRAAESSSGLEVPLRSSDGRLLAVMYVYEGRLRIVPSGELEFRTSTPPFRSFLIDRVFEGMRRADERRVGEGALSPDEVFRYEVRSDGDVIRSIEVWNYGGERRLGEIKSAVRWTLERMYEKTAVRG
ncbi:MAG TPA: hypothetical protein ENF98_01055 [Candidatus Bathyarchaeota archaeon]|nr:hypothetical protein [Candidatus Bathyarchaeota archaeon]